MGIHTKKEEINDFIRTYKGDRVTLNKILKRRWNVQLLNKGRYKPHTGLKQRVKALMQNGLTKEQALDRLEVLYEQSADV